MDKMYKLLGGRSEGLWKRHRAEVRDEYDEAIAAGADPAKDRPKDPQLLLRLLPANLRLERG